MIQMEVFKASMSHYITCSLAVPHTHSEHFVQKMTWHHPAEVAMRHFFLNLATLPV